MMKKVQIYQHMLFMMHVYFGLLSCSRMPVKTRNAKKQLFCEGTPCELPTTEPNTYREIIEYYYYLTSMHDSCKNRNQAKFITTKIIEVWKNVNSNLPLISDKSVENKVTKVLDTVRAINWKTAKLQQKDMLNDKLDHVFDISACTCDLEEVPCLDRRIQCKKPECNETHIVCICPPEINVPVSERMYLKDQRSRTGNRGLYQMSSFQYISTKKTARKARSTKNHSSSEVLDHQMIDVSLNF